ncbi:hypothetical protein ACH4KU_18580 [Streptomyces althioticus]|uniref:hypothetical protein n=1 Tax=Streptomyces althioticus TaxID=83380 RepID=UPI003796766C
MYPDNGYGSACTTTAEQDSAGSTACTTDKHAVHASANNHWRNADPVIVTGDVEGLPDFDGDGTMDPEGARTSTRPSSPPPATARAAE